MPYLLETSSSSARVNPGTALTIGGNIGDYIEFSGYADSGNSGGTYRILGATTGYSNLVELSSSSVHIRCSGRYLFFSSGYTQPSTGSDFILKFEKISSRDFEVFLDGASLGVGESPSDNLVISQFLNFNSSNEAFQGGCYYIEACTDGTGTATNLWNNTTGTGSDWIDQVGSNDATQAGTWPADDSEWVFYSTGPNTPVNPSITSLLATSARLNWEQG